MPKIFDENSFVSNICSRNNFDVTWHSAVYRVSFNERGCVLLTDLSALGSASDIWAEWRFEPWRNGSAEGLYRRATLVKSSFMGEIARYYADDYIVWKYRQADIDKVRQSAKPEKDLMVQRYIFLQAEGKGSLKKSSFTLGFRGFVEVYKYTLGDEASKGIVDIAFLCNAANERLSEKLKTY